MLSNWGKGIPKHMDSKIRIAGNDIFNFIRKLVEFKLNIAYCVIIRGKGDTLGMEGICINSGTDIV